MDQDADENGVTDCRLGEELVYRIEQALAPLLTLRSPQSAKQRRRMRRLAREIKEALAAMRSYGMDHLAEVQVSEASTWSAA